MGPKITINAQVNMYYKVKPAVGDHPVVICYADRSSCSNKSITVHLPVCGVCCVNCEVSRENDMM